MDIFFYHGLNVGLEHFRVKLALEASCGTERMEGLFIIRLWQKSVERRRPWCCVIHAAERKRKSSKTEPPWVPSSPRISLETSNGGNTANRASLASLWSLTGLLVSTWIASIRGNVDLTTWGSLIPMVLTHLGPKSQCYLMIFVSWVCGVGRSFSLKWDIMKDFLVPHFWKN